jgi:hypothetical protein
VIALAVAALVSGAIALAAGGTWSLAALHAAPVVTLATFGAHLMWIGRMPAAVVATDTAPTATPAPQVTQAVQVNVAAAAALPRTIAAFIAARAAELPQHSPAMLAAELGTSADTVRRMLQIAATAEPTTATEE